MSQDSLWKIWSSEVIETIFFGFCSLPATLDAIIWQLQNIYLRWELGLKRVKPNCQVVHKTCHLSPLYRVVLFPHCSIENDFGGIFGIRVTFMRHVLWNSRRIAFVRFFSRQINNDFLTFCSYSSLAELKCIRSRNEEDRSYAQDLAKSQRYSLQLERQLRELLQSPQGSGQLLNRFFFIKRAAKLLSCNGYVLSKHLHAFLT